MVSDAEIMAAQKLLATREGVFGEPASAASVAGLLKMSKKLDLSGKNIVCVITGTGLKDAETAIKNAEPFIQLSADLEEVEKALGWA
jgi:threonine synthase